MHVQNTITKYKVVPVGVFPPLRAGIDPGQIASTSQGTHTIHSLTHTKKQFTNQP